VSSALSVTPFDATAVVEAIQARSSVRPEAKSTEQNQAWPNKTKEIDLDRLGFVRQNPDISKRRLKI
jgi:hypothetical protein